MRKIFGDRAHHPHHVIHVGVDVEVRLPVLLGGLQVADHKLTRVLERRTGVKQLLENLFRCPYMILLGVCGHVAGWYDLQGGTHHNTEVGHDTARGDNMYYLLSKVIPHTFYHGNSSPVGVAEAEISVGQLVLPVQNEVQQSSSAPPSITTNLFVLNLIYLAVSR